MKSLTDLQKMRFNEPIDDQDWLDIGADLRIKIRTEFSRLRSAATEREEIYKELVDKMKAALKRISEEVTGPHLNLHGDLVVSPTLSSLVAYKVVLEVEKIEKDLK